MVELKDVTVDFVYYFITQRDDKKTLAFWQNGLPIMEPEELAVMMETYYVELNDSHYFKEYQHTQRVLREGLPTVDWLAVVDKLKNEYLSYH